MVTSSVAAQAGPVSQAVSAASLGLKDGLRPQLLMLSIGVALGAGGFWLLIFMVWSADIWHLAQVAAHWFFSGAAAASEAPVADGGWWATIWGGVVQGLSWLVALLIFLAALALLVMLSMQIMLELFLMPLVQRQCLPRYPSLKLDGAGSLRFNILTSLKLLAVLVLGLPLWLIPVVGPLVHLALVAYLNIRSLVNDALDGVATLEERQALVRTHRGAMLCLGLIMQLMFMIPFVGLIMASVMGASVCHLFMPPLVDMRAQAR